MDDSGAAYGIALAIVILIATHWYLHHLDRARILAHVARHGGRVLDISWNPFAFGWLGWFGMRFYDVRYTLDTGQVFSGTCVTAAFYDVHWLSGAPPGSAEHGRLTKAVAASASSEEGQYSSSPAEPITCLSCRGEIPASATRCPNCGWSYQQQSDD